MTLSLADQRLLDATRDAHWYNDKAIEKQQAEAVEAALQAGANPNLLTEAGSNILFDCVKGGSPSVVAVLLKYGADPNAPTWFKWSWSEEQLAFSTLHQAVDRGRPPIVRALLLAGARVDVKDHQGKTPLDIAKKAGIRKMLELAAAGELTAGSKVAPAKRAPAPQALVDFFAEEAARYQGGTIDDLIAEGRPTKLKFPKKPSAALFTQREVDPLTCPDYHVLASLDGEEHFLVVDGKSAALPVLRWDSEDAKFHPVAESLAAFVQTIAPHSKKKPKR